MSASSVCTSLTVSNLALTAARCTGFTKVHGENDFLYVVDLEWTDERRVSIKRTFIEFQQFNNDLFKLFPELHSSKLYLRTSFREGLTSLFTKDKRALAEKRELLLDHYLFHMLRQPERIRHCNIVLSFFDSRSTDPKPCKSNSPSEKADSGIDLTSDSLDHASKECYPTETQHCHQITGAQIDDDNREDEYDGDTSQTETDDETYDEDYFLDVGFGELMLQTSVDESQQPDIPGSPATDCTESSMWCSNLDKFSNILKSSMTNLSVATDNQSKTYKTLKTQSSKENSEAVIVEALEESPYTREETSETESQITAEDRQISETCESSDEESYYSKPLSKTNMKHYYLSSNNLNTSELE